METVLKIFGRGQVTLPKKMRERYGDTKYFIARLTNRGILIEPLETKLPSSSPSKRRPSSVVKSSLAKAKKHSRDEEDVELIETDKEVRLHFNRPIPMKEVLRTFKEADASLRKAAR